MSKTYIISGNRMQYDLFIGRLPITEDLNGYQYVHGPDAVRGIVNPHGLFIGSWKERKDITEIVMNLMAASHIPNPTLRKILDEVQRVSLKDLLVSINGMLLSPNDPGVRMQMNAGHLQIAFNQAPAAGNVIDVRTMRGTVCRYMTNGTDTHFSFGVVL